MMVVVLKILDLLLLIAPAIVELFRGKRDEGTKIAAYVREQQAKKLEVYEALAKEKGDELSAITKTRVAVVRGLLARVRDVRKPS